MASLVCCVDEELVHTQLALARPLEIANRSVTYTEWTPGRSHPRRFSKYNITPALLTQMREDRRREKRIDAVPVKSLPREGYLSLLAAVNESCSADDGSALPCALFARKFAPDTVQRLLKFAPKVLGF